jgi:hypothetical protein
MYLFVLLITFYFRRAKNLLLECRVEVDRRIRGFSIRGWPRREKSWKIEEINGS